MALVVQNAALAMLDQLAVSEFHKEADTLDLPEAGDILGLENRALLVQALLALLVPPNLVQDQVQDGDPSHPLPFLYQPTATIPALRPAHLNHQPCPTPTLMPPLNKKMTTTTSSGPARSSTTKAKTPTSVSEENLWSPSQAKVQAEKPKRTYGAYHPGSVSTDMARAKPVKDSGKPVSMPQSPRPGR